ncbi:hypothetical protein E2562_033718, partial [Oryza meyeriana var. granulata]
MDRYSLSLLAQPLALRPALPPRLLAGRRLQELLVPLPSEPLPLLPSLLAYRSLCSADLTNCRLPAVAAGASSFPHLHELTLRYAFASSPVLHGLLTGCPALASLSLERVFGCRSLYVRTRTLCNLTVSVSLRRREELGEELQDLVVEDQPINGLQLSVFALYVDEEMASIICNSLPRLKKLEIPNSNMSCAAIIRFLDCLEELEYLDISGYETSAISSAMLRKASRLNIFIWNSKFELGEFMDCSNC